MPRTKRVVPGGMVFHALNRGLGRMKLFSAERDYLVFEETVEKRLCHNCTAQPTLDCPAINTIRLCISGYHDRIVISTACHCWPI
jgi:hypothetical protein